MKIAVVTAHTPSILWFRIDMLHEFVKRGCIVAVIGNEDESKWKDFFSSYSIDYYKYSISRNGLNPSADLKTKSELESLFKIIQPEKVFTYQVKPNIYGTLAAHKAGVHDVYVMMGGLGSVFRSPGIKNRIVKTIVSIEYRMALRYANTVFFQNSDDANLFVEAGICDARQVEMTKGSGVNTEQFPFRPMPEDCSFLFVGRLVKGKGVIEYLEASRRIKRRHPDIQCCLIGPFDTNPSSLSARDLKQYIDDGTVLFYGAQDDVRPFLEKCGCFVLPSYYGEGTPKSALEAMSTGRPLIVADAVGSREVVKHGRNGLLVQPQSIESLECAMEAIATDKTLRERMAKESRKMAEEEFDVKLVNQVICHTMGL